MITRAGHNITVPAILVYLARHHAARLLMRLAAIVAPTYPKAAR